MSLHLLRKSLMENLLFCAVPLSEPQENISKSLVFLSFQGVRKVANGKILINTKHSNT